MKALVCGAGGFIGSKMVECLLDNGYTVRAVSFRPVEQWVKKFDSRVECLVADLRNTAYSRNAVHGGVDLVYNFAAKVGGVGFIGGATKVDCLLSSLINTNLLRASVDFGVSRYFFASSSCVYPSSRVGLDGVAIPLHEDGLLAPSGGYGVEKLFSEQMCAAFAEERKLSVCVARYAGVYGPGDDLKGAENKDHAPAALCRKVIQAKLSGVHEINVWGDGGQTRNFLYIDDCVEGTYRLMCSKEQGPVNLGSREVVTVNDMISMLEKIAGVKLNRFYNREAPEGVRHRAMDNGKLWEAIGWEPSTKLWDGLDALYRDLYDQALKKL